MGEKQHKWEINNQYPKRCPSKETWGLSCYVKEHLFSLYTSTKHNEGRLILR